MGGFRGSHLDSGAIGLKRIYFRVMESGADRERISRILIIKPSSLGDIVHALPVLAALRAAYPKAHIAWLVGSSFTTLLEGNPLLNEVIPFDRVRYGRMWRSPGGFIAFWRFVLSLRRRRFDLVIDLQGLLRSGLMTWFSGARRRVGFAHAREGSWLFYTTRVRPSAVATHAVDRLAALARQIGLPMERPEFLLAVREEERRDAVELLQRIASRKLEGYIAVVPGARWESKLWPTERLAALIDRLHAEGRPPCVLLGSPADRGLAQQIETGCESQVVNLVGKTSLRQLVALIDGADLVICQDSGPMHIAAALDKPLVAIFGPTDPSRTGPYADRVRVVSHDVPCSPCQRRRCPLRHHDCMRLLSVEPVIERVHELLDCKVR